MKKYYTLLVGLHFTVFCLAQTFDIKQSEIISVSKGSVYMKVLMVEESNVYSLKIEKLKKKIDPSYYLCKYDKNMNKVYENNISKHIGDRFMYYTGSLQGRLYVFTSEIKKQKFYIYGIEIDKTTGNNIGEEKTICIYEMASKFDRFDYMIKPDSDSANWIITATNDNQDDDAYHCSLINANLENKNTIKVEPKFKDNEIFELQQVIIDKDNNLIIAGPVYDIVEYQKKKITWIQKKYLLNKYDSKGKQLLNHSLNLNGKSLLACKLLKIPTSDKIIVGGTYCNSSKNDKTDGMFFSVLDNTTLNPINISFQELSAANHAKLQEDPGYPGFNDFIFYDFLFDKKTNQLVLSAESYSFQVKAVKLWYSDAINDPKVGKPVYEQDAKNFIDKESSRNIDTYTYNCGDILIMTIDLNTNAITNHFAVFKRQVEKIAENPDNNYPGIQFAVSHIPPSRYYEPEPVAPFYSSYAVSFVNGNLLVIYNDQQKEVKDEKKKDGYPGFYTSTLSCTLIDLKNGSVVKKVISKNGDQPVFMPRFAFAHNDNIFIPAMKITNKLEGDCKLIKVTAKN